MSSSSTFPPHSDGCMGRGPDNPAGLRLAPRREGDEVVVPPTHFEAFGTVDEHPGLSRMSADEQAARGEGAEPRS